MIPCCCLCVPTYPITPTHSRAGWSHTPSKPPLAVPQHAPASPSLDGSGDKATNPGCGAAPAASPGHAAHPWAFFHGFHWGKQRPAGRTGSPGSRAACPNRQTGKRGMTDCTEKGSFSFGMSEEASPDSSEPWPWADLYKCHH